MSEQITEAELKEFVRLVNLIVCDKSRSAEDRKWEVLEAFNDVDFENMFELAKWFQGDL